MRLDMSQQMKMDQRMVLAPRMIQSMEILQLPLLALQERIEQELLSNPVLEQEEPVAEGLETPEQETQNTPTETTDGEQSLRIKDDNNKTEDFQRLDNLGNDFDDYLTRSSYTQARRSAGEPDRKLEAMQNTAAPAQSLNEYLHEQWRFIECEPVIKKAGAVIIDFIDEAGYLSVELASLREHVRQEITPAQLEEALRLVQTLEPIGVGARDLAECMITQLKNSNEDRTLEIELISDYLEDIEMNRFPTIARKTKRSMTEIKEAIKIISRLDPRPGMQVGRHESSYIVPDIIVEYDENNDIYTSRLTDGSTPNLRINKLYSKMIKQGEIPADAKEFLRNNMQSARWLLESIEQRKTTLLRVVNYVLKSQKDFLDRGPLHLKPLPMTETADALGIHVGTVSRAVSGKYMQTPIGIFPLRYFFSQGTETASGQSVSWGAVKAKLQEIINNEDKAHPFNDDELRRTVAKYRNLMNIPPARRRKQYD